MPSTDPWWQRAVVYQIYPRSFLDTDGDGVGDLEGIRRRLPYLAELGVDALWLSPFYRSPMADFGYDVADYCDVDPLFGTLADFDALLTEAHAAGLRVVVDWVPNHSSDQHPWFLDACSSRDSEHRDWYVWRDPADPAAVAAGDGPGPPPNNWVATFDWTQPAWTWHAPTQQWYLHSFLPQQPELNWGNPALRQAMHDVLRFWLDRGVDGFRVDVVQLLGKDPALADDPPELTGYPHFNDDERTHEILRALRTMVDAYPGDRVMVGEVYLLSTERVARYYGRGDELHLSFNFSPLYAPWTADKWRNRVERVIEELDPIDAWPTWVLSNHDNPRHRTRYGSESIARAAAVLLLGLRGTPFLYAGEELGLEDAVVPEEATVDPGGRDGCRAPIPWDATPSHGWPVERAWLPWPPDAETHNAVVEDQDSMSTLALYRRLLVERRRSPALQTGTFSWLPAPPDVLAWRRSQGSDERVVIVNFGDQPVAVPVDGSWEVAVSSTVVEGRRFDGALATHEAILLAPAGAGGPSVEGFAE